MSEHAQNLRLSLLLSLGLAGPVACSNKEPEAGGTTTAAAVPPTAPTAPAAPEAPATPALAAVPQAEYPVCTGEWDPESGPCCVDVYCSAMPEGAATCPAADEVDASILTGKGLGSGDCACDRIAGPFAAPEGKDGDCCYTVGIQSCEGRPLIIQGGIRRASLRRGVAWA